MQRAIGVIDSGIGGLTVAQELMRQLPNERIIYLGDTARCPYGPREPHEIQTFTRQMAAFLMEKKIKMLVIACNTATAFTLDILQEELPIPVLGVIQPGARAAIKTARTNRVAVIGTEGTIASGAYAQTLQTIKPSLHVESLACPEFVPLVEKGLLSGATTEKIVKKTLRPLQERGRFDTLILGCTHYPLLKPIIQDVMGDDVAIISSSEETARETSVLLSLNHLLNEETVNIQHQFYTTGHSDVFAKLVHIVFAATELEMSAISSIQRAIIDQETDSGE
ncbi:glutamate racemase [Lentibacillus saliphilus]|uniref:glutamate racemase n=1 Tax=Lentibacillus saliphilus TaxID=2737028 RepID=UPI001C2F6BCA